MRYYVDTSALITYYHEPTQPEAVWLGEFVGAHADGGLLLSQLTILEYTAYLLRRRRRPRNDPQYLKPRRLRAVLERLEQDVSPTGTFRRHETELGPPWLDRALQLIHEHRRRQVGVCDVLHLAAVLPHVHEIGLLTRDQAMRDVCDDCRIVAPRAP